MAKDAPGPTQASDRYAFRGGVLFPRPTYPVFNAFFPGFSSLYHDGQASLQAATGTLFCDSGLCKSVPASNCIRVHLAYTSIWTMPGSPTTRKKICGKCFGCLELVRRHNVEHFRHIRQETKIINAGDIYYRKEAES